VIVDSGSFSLVFKTSSFNFPPHLLTGQHHVFLLFSLITLLIGCMRNYHANLGLLCAVVFLSPLYIVPFKSTTHQFPVFFVDCKKLNHFITTCYQTALGNLSHLVKQYQTEALLLGAGAVDKPDAAYTVIMLLPCTLAGAAPSIMHSSSRSIHHTRPRVEHCQQPREAQDTGGNWAAPKQSGRSAQFQVR
jgi:hypothetical protein